MYPRVTVNLNKLRHNLGLINDMCHGQNISTAIVTKCVCADSRIVQLIEESSADMFADSRLENLKKIVTRKQKLLLRLGMPSEARDIVAYSDASLQSQLSTVFALDDAAKKLSKKHKVILMVDLGDLREGIYFKEIQTIKATARAIHACENIEFFGIGANLTCFGGILPDESNMKSLVDIANEISDAIGFFPPVITAGNSSAMSMLRSGKLPCEINNLRIGEAFLLGKDTSDGSHMDGFYDDAFILEAELIELERKPSKPFGSSGPNAFGEYVEFEDKGNMKRGICAIGRQDADTDGLRPLDEGIEVIGASSDHLILDTHENGSLNVGDVLRFVPDYGALLRLFTSPYVKREYIE
ncbi:MAG: alanine/ornithine racemase family PLP-dependent enzyme [Clostridia bacterium]|nr:alanine/ornithine racemase family PLP-dependent enzyme [Clostridia bacterium]